jgi:hypothetical protein
MSYCQSFDVSIVHFKVLLVKIIVIFIGIGIFLILAITAEAQLCAFQVFFLATTSFSLTTGFALAAGGFQNVVHRG